MSITITNPEGRNVEFKDQRGPTCGLYALSFVLEYLYDIKIPATADGDKTRESLRNRFKKDGKTVIGELYDATSSMADYIKALDPSKITCQSVACDVAAIIETLNGSFLRGCLWQTRSFRNSRSLVRFTERPGSSRNRSCLSLGKGSCF